jgi:outer membrane scaffolding protein for murein synthesis (MipA/OmpV family)
MRAFYGVSPEQSALSGLPQFQAHQGISEVYGELVAGYELASRWALGLDVTVARLQDDAAESPFTESPHAEHLACIGALQVQATLQPAG